ncbi:MAG: alpha-galactosidase [bacterium]
MIRSKRFLLGLINVLLCLILNLHAEEVSFIQQKKGPIHSVTLSNSRIQCRIEMYNKRLSFQTVQLTNKQQISLSTGCDFSLDMMWTGWRAPGKIANADNMVQFSNNSFEVQEVNTEDTPQKGKQLNIILKGIEIPFDLILRYQMSPDDYFLKRRILLRDTTGGAHFLRWMWPVHSILRNKVEIIKSGGFGQPLAFIIDQGGAFIGCEYPIAENQCKPLNKEDTQLCCGYEYGRKIGEQWIESEWVVFGLTPDRRVKLWFTNYLDDIRVAKLKPYLLYNSWYDVRSEIYTERTEDVMNEKNLVRIIHDFKREITEERNLHLDAFVMDDGWDVYESDWQLRKEEFPRGLKPIADELAEMGAELGIWFGPTGGYSYRLKRINWMDEHGYETVGGQGESNNKMLCLAGEKYKTLFKKRVVDFINQYEVGYYKWDGIQFSCSEPDHGHPIGEYSRRAVMESVIDISSAVREANPDIFINITSGTWLSPWWMKYANTIWMQGRDYGYAEVPSISKRDAAMTYRDVVLHTNLKVNDFWFPMSNLMTHGIIKGHLQKLGGEKEPLDKFTNNALLYFARGVSMWELYISPNLLTEGEWKAIARSIRWARDRFDILMHTEMVGGSPRQGKAYGYIHFAEDKGIAALRNPSIENQNIRIILDHDLGFSSQAQSLVLERVYPDRYISPTLYASGDSIDISLMGYETAVYEIYPLKESEYPLLAGTVFSIEEITDSLVNYNIYTVDDHVRLLNPDKVTNESVTIQPQNLPECGEKIKFTIKDKRIFLEFTVNPLMQKVSLACLFTKNPRFPSDPERSDTKMELMLDGKEIIPRVQKQQSWQWMTVPVSSGLHTLRVDTKSDNQDWQGKIQFWLLGTCTPQPRTVTFVLKKPLGYIRPFPPCAQQEGRIKSNKKLAEVVVK